MNHILTTETQENNDHISLISLYPIPKASLQQPKNSTHSIKISPNKFVYINLELDGQQKTQLTELLKRQAGAFAWDYSERKGINLETFSHHIYTHEYIKPVRQPQRNMNLALKYIVKKELWKLLNLY